MVVLLMGAGHGNHAINHTFGKAFELSEYLVRAEAWRFTIPRGCSHVPYHKCFVLTREP